MQKLFSVLIMSLLLSSCSFIHKMDIEQGNVYTEDTVKRLHKGMTQAQVKDIMGSPILMNTFNNNRVEYVYTFKPGGGNMREKSLTLIFNHGVLREMNYFEAGNK